TNDLLMVEYGSGDEHPAGVVHAVHDGAVLFIDFLVAQFDCGCVSSLAGSMAVRLTCMLAAKTEADHAEWHGRDDLKAAFGVIGDQRGKVAGPLDVLAQHGLDAVAAKV